MAPVAISNRITLDPAYIVAILPYNPQINRYAEEYGYTVHSYCYVPQSLIILDDGDTCLAVKDTPAEPTPAPTSKELAQQKAIMKVYRKYQQREYERIEHPAQFPSDYFFSALAELVLDDRKFVVSVI